MVEATTPLEGAWSGVSDVSEAVKVTTPLEGACSGVGEVEATTTPGRLPQACATLCGWSAHGAVYRVLGDAQSLDSR